MRKSFTLVELLVTSAIIMIMLGITIAYSQKGEGINKVNRSVERIAFDIRRIANLSMQTRQIGDKKVCGWGIVFDESKTNQYIIFSDFCEGESIRGDKRFSEAEIHEVVKLNWGVVIKEFDINMLMYLPPEPRLEIYDEYDNLANDGLISLTTVAGNFVKSISINQAGMISTK